MSERPRHTCFADLYKGSSEVTLLHAGVEAPWQALVIFGVMGAKLPVAPL